MRDRRFIAVHRGGPLELGRHRLLAAWAADCAEHLLPLFERSEEDRRPHAAIAVARAWSRGEASVGVAQKAALAAHAAAREASRPAATAVARAAGHAAATAHAADHALGPIYYGMEAVKAAGGSPDEEQLWQFDHLPEAIRALVVSGWELRFLPKRKS